MSALEHPSRVPMNGPAYAGGLAWPLGWRLLAATYAAYHGTAMYLLDPRTTVPGGWLLLAVTMPWWNRTRVPAWLPGLAFATFSGWLGNAFDLALHQAFLHQTTVSGVPCLAFGTGAAGVLLLGFVARLTNRSLSQLGWPVALLLPVLAALGLLALGWPFRPQGWLEDLGLVLGVLPAAYMVKREEAVRLAFDAGQRGQAANALMVGGLAGWSVKLTGQSLWVPMPGARAQAVKVLHERPVRWSAGWLAWPLAALAVALVALSGGQLHLPWPDARVEVLEGSRGPSGALAPAPDGSDYVTDTQKILHLLPTGQLETITRPDAGLPDNPLKYLAAMKDGRVYAGGRPWLLQTSDGRWQPGPPLPNGRRRFQVVGLAATRDGGLWIRQRELLEVPERWRPAGQAALDRLVYLDDRGKPTAVVGGPRHWVDGLGVWATPAGTALMIDVPGTQLVEVREDGDERRLKLTADGADAPGQAQLAFDPEGRLYGVGNNRLWAIAPDGTCTRLNPEALPDEKDHREAEERWGAGGLRGASFPGETLLACDGQGRLLLGGWGLRRVTWRGKPPGKPWPMNPTAGWGAWTHVPALPPEATNPPPLDRQLHPKPRPAGPLGALDDVVAGEDVFTTGARLHRHLKVTQRDELGVPTHWQGPLLGRPNAKVELLWGQKYTYTDTARVWPTDGFKVELPSASAASVGKDWYALYQVLSRRYGPGWRYGQTERDPGTGYDAGLWYVSSNLPAYAARAPKLPAWFGEGESRFWLAWQLPDKRSVTLEGMRHGVRLTIKRP